jgi:hypothetical protein
MDLVDEQFGYSLLQAVWFSFLRRSPFRHPVGLQLISTAGGITMASRPEFWSRLTDEV